MRFLGVVVAVCLLLSGCSGSDADDAAAKKDEAFLDALVAADVLADDADDAARDEAVDKGRAWCEKLTDPDTTRKDVARAIAELLRDSSTTAAAQQATTFYATAAKTYCPDAADDLR